MLAPGHHLYPGPDGAWRYSAPGDVFVRVRGDAQVLAAVHRRHTGAPDEPTPAVDNAAVDRCTAELIGRGVLTAAPAQDPPRRLHIHLDGDGPVTDVLATLLHATGVASQCTLGPADEQTVADCDLLVAAAGWLPDTRWRRLDEWCVTHRTPWHRSHIEGDTIVVGPLWIPDRTPSYRDVRGRRLAAAALPDELRAHWAYLDSDLTTPAVTLPPGAAEVTAGLIVADVHAYAAGTTVPGEGHQVVYQSGTATLRRHPVLALPRLAVNPA